MSRVNTPRECVICDRIFYPSVSKSLFCCERPECQKEFEGVMEDMDNRTKNFLKEEEDERKGNTSTE